MLRPARPPREGRVVWTPEPSEDGRGAFDGRVGEPGSAAIAVESRWRPAWQWPVAGTAFSHLGARPVMIEMAGVVAISICEPGNSSLCRRRSGTRLRAKGSHCVVVQDLDGRDARTPRRISPTAGTSRGLTGSAVALDHFSEGIRSGRKRLVEATIGCRRGAEC